MKKDIHPKYYPAAKVVCACGNTWITGSTKQEIHTDMCSACHPFFTGEQRIVDTAGQVERFEKRRKQSDGKKEEQVQRLARKPRTESVFEFVTEQAKATQQQAAPAPAEAAVSSEPQAETQEASAPITVSPMPTPDIVAPKTGTDAPTAGTDAPAETKERPARKARSKVAQDGLSGTPSPNKRRESASRFGGALKAEETPAAAGEKPKRERKPRKAEAKASAAQPADSPTEASKSPGTGTP